MQAQMLSTSGLYNPPLPSVKELSADHTSEFGTNPFGFDLAKAEFDASHAGEASLPAATNDSGTATAGMGCASGTSLEI